MPFDWGLTTRSDDEAEEPSIGETYVVCWVCGVIILRSGEETEPTEPIRGSNGVIDGDSGTERGADFGENKVLSVRVREVLVLGVLNNDSRCWGRRMRRDSICRSDTTLGGEGGSETREEREGETTSDGGDETLRLTGVGESTETGETVGKPEVTCGATWRLGG